MEKLIRRHPHVFGSTDVDGSDEVLRNWEQIKRVERGETFESMLAGASVALPALSPSARDSEAGCSGGFRLADYRASVGPSA